MKRFFNSLPWCVVLLPLAAACLPPVNPAPVVGSASVTVSHGLAQSPEGGAIGTLLSQTVQPAVGTKALRISAWGGGTSQHPGRTFYLYVGQDLPIAVNLTTPILWFRCETEVVKTGGATAQYSSVCFVGNLSGDTVTAVHSLDGSLKWSEPLVIRGAGKGVNQGDVTQTGMVVEVLN